MRYPESDLLLWIVALEQKRRKKNRWMECWGCGQTGTREKYEGVPQYN